MVSGADDGRHSTGPNLAMSQRAANWKLARFIFLVPIAALALTLMPDCAAAQMLVQGVAAGAIGGVAQDESGGVLPGVTVTATPNGGGPTSSTVTSSDGRYSITVAPGTYVLSAELSGFAPFSSAPIAVVPAATATLDVTLKLPTYGDTVVVTGSRAPESLRTAPVAVTVLRSAEIDQHLGDQLLRPAAFGAGSERDRAVGARRADRDPRRDRT